MKLLTRILRHLSMRSLVMFSLGVTLLPMLAGLVAAYFAVGQLSSLSQRAIHQVAAEAKNGQELLNQLSDLERSGKAYLSLRDADGFNDYKLIHQRLAERLQGLLDAAKTEGNPLAAGLEALAADEKDAFEAMASCFPPRQKSLATVKDFNLRDLTPDSDPLQSVKARASGLTFGYAVHIEEQARSLESLSRETKQDLVLYIVLLLSMSCIVLAVFVYLLHQPIRQIDLFIRTLGAGNFTQPIRVVGTRDAEFLGERLEWLRTHLNDLEMAKQRFMRNVSHEIKTPLATLHEGAELLLDEVVGELNREQKDIAGILVSNTDKMDKLIVKLINYSQVSACRARQRFVRVDMRLLINELLEDYRLQLLNKSITVAESIKPVELFVDKGQMRTIVDNLLSNAVKYSPEGGEIRLSLIENAGHMELEIEDDGPGIDPDEREKVFEPLYLGRSSRALGVKGTGFGLAIVAECVASHFGKVEVLTSHEGRAGAHIKVKIPLQSLNYRKSTDDNPGSSNP
jgi:two-component system sensor histidine kinase GlrK